MKRMKLTEIYKVATRIERICRCGMLSDKELDEQAVEDRDVWQRRSQELQEKDGRSTLLHCARQAKRELVVQIIRELGKTNEHAID